MKPPGSRAPLCTSPGTRIARGSSPSNMCCRGSRARSASRRQPVLQTEIGTVNYRDATTTDSKTIITTTITTTERKKETSTIMTSSRRVIITARCPCSSLGDFYSSGGHSENRFSESTARHLRGEPRGVAWRGVARRGPTRRRRCSREL